MRLQRLKGAEDHAKAEAAPVTLALLCGAYVLDVEARGKAAHSIVRAKCTTNRLAHFFGRRMDAPLAVTEADLYAYRARRLRHWAKRGKQAKDGAKPLLPGFRFPARVFLPEDETCGRGSSRKTN